MEFVFGSETEKEGKASEEGTSEAYKEGNKEEFKNGDQVFGEKNQSVLETNLS
jgi:hypothetical protein